jgi:hypothetical protein
VPTSACGPLIAEYSVEASPATPAASPATSGSNRGRRLSKVHRATEWLKPSLYDQARLCPCQSATRCRKPACVSCQLGSPHYNEVHRTRLSDIVQGLSTGRDDVRQLRPSINPKRQQFLRRTLNNSQKGASAREGSEFVLGMYERANYFWVTSKILYVSTAINPVFVTDFVKNGSVRFVTCPSTTPGARTRTPVSMIAPMPKLRD